MRNLNFVKGVFFTERPSTACHSLPKTESVVNHEEGLSRTQSSAFPIIVLCCSAGGLQPCRAILESLPKKPGMAFVVISHRRLDNPTLLRHLLGRSSRMPVLEVTEGMNLQANHVFLAPPQMEMTTDGLVLNLRDIPRPVGWPILITVLLRSLAINCASRTVAIILSGMGFDGSPALEQLKRNGGATYAQSDAEYPSMPDSAVDTGYVDFKMTVGEIGERLVAMGHRQGSLASYDASSW